MRKSNYATGETQEERNEHMTYEENNTQSIIMNSRSVGALPRLITDAYSSDLISRL